MIPIDRQLEQVARGDIPPDYAHVVGVSIAPGGRYAIVMLTTNQGSQVEFDQTVAERVGNRWEPHTSGTPSTVIYIGDHRAAILCNYSDPLPPDVEWVVVRDGGEEHDVRVENGYFLYAAWKKDTVGDNTTDPPEPEFVRAIRPPSGDPER